MYKIKMFIPYFIILFFFSMSIQADDNISFFIEILNKIERNYHLEKPIYFEKNDTRFKITIRNRKLKLTTLKKWNENEISLNNKSELEILFAILEKLYAPHELKNEALIALPIYDARMQTVSDIRIMVLKQLIQNPQSGVLQRDLLLTNDYYYKKMQIAPRNAVRKLEKNYLDIGYTLGEIAEELQQNVYHSNYKTLSERDFFAEEIEQYVEITFENIKTTIPSLENEKKRAIITGFYNAKLASKHKILDESLTPLKDISFIKNIFKDIDPVLERRNYFPIRAQYRKKIRKKKQEIDITMINQFELIFQHYETFEMEGSATKRTASGVYYRNCPFLYIQHNNFELSASNANLYIEKYGNTFRLKLDTNELLTQEDTILFNKKIKFYSQKIAEEKKEQQFHISFLQNKFLKITEEGQQIKLLKLMDALAERNVPEEWFIETMNANEFKLHTEIEKYFRRLPEHKVKRKEKSKDWYRKRFGVDKKIVDGKKFIKKHKETLKKIPLKFGFDYELVVALIGIETHFASAKQKGYFYVFNALVSQYLFTSRQKFAIGQLAALYEFSKKIDQPSSYFIGSFAGACGWGQFIPSSLNAFFIDVNGIERETDIYSVDDNLMSIANYLYRHGLNSKTKHDKRRQKDAVYAYNHSHAYVDAVLYIYAGLKSSL